MPCQRGMPSTASGWIPGSEPLCAYHFESWESGTNKIRKLQDSLLSSLRVIRSWQGGYSKPENLDGGHDN